MSTFYLLSELEVASSKVEDLMFVREELEVLLRLSMSKIGAQAKGTERP